MRPKSPGQVGGRKLLAEIGIVVGGLVRSCCRILSCPVGRDSFLFRDLSIWSHCIQLSG